MKLKKNIIANYFGQFYMIIIGIIMVPFYLEYLGAEAYGLVGFFALMQSWMALLDMGFSPTLSREVAKIKSRSSDIEKQQFKSLLHSLEFVFIVVSLVISLSIVFFSNWIAQSWLQLGNLDVQSVTYCISLMGVLVGLRFITTLYNSGIAGAEAQVWLNSANIVLNTLRFVGVLVILHFIDNDIELFFEYQVIVGILAFVIFIFKFYKLLGIGEFRIYFSYQSIKPIIPFAVGIAYTGGIWIFLTQLDKLLLSKILTLEEFGYFTLVALVSNAILQLVGPISQALQPRMISLLHQNKEGEMLLLYRKATQFMAIFIFALVGIVGVFSYELLYAWSGNKEASFWAKDILFWYVMGNGILAISGLQYALQFAHGKLKMHVRYNTVLALVSIPLIVWSAYTYSAIGVALVWFMTRLIGFIVWVPVVHHKFASGIHKIWLINDILPVLISSIGYLWVVEIFHVDFTQISRIEVFIILLFFGLGMLLVNMLASSEIRKRVILLFKRKKMYE